MSAFKAYPVVATTPSRKQRKAQRRKIFQENSEAYAVARRARRDARRKAASND